MIRSTLLFLALAIASVHAQTTSPVFGQCGGEGWTGPTACATGSVCVVQNPFYSQCVPGTVTTTTGPTTTVSTSTASKTSTASTSTASVPAQTGFVKVSGTKFTLNGAPYTFFGGNAYWLPLMGYSTADINTAFDAIVGSGATTVRTWGFNEVTSPNGIYFHLWNGNTATVNTGANGLEMLDAVIAAAKAHGVRLVIALHNQQLVNFIWTLANFSSFNHRSDYGGMDVYTAQILGSGQFHDVFYTNPTIIAAFKTYVQAVVTRYINEPTILAWELANEPRCGGSNTAASPTCNTTTITTWIETMSSFVKSLDSNHLVTIGDEGFFNRPGSNNFDFVYQGTLGIDFEANIKITTVDYATFHMYPESWGESDVEPWGVQWITDHATVMASANKPVIMEEFGIVNTTTRTSTYSDWYSTVISTDITGDLIWQSGAELSVGPTPDDGYMIFPGNPEYTLMQQHAAALKARG
ncbi:Carbohydrate-binding module family 1 protein/glycoside hydrolase family 5 protein [Mycena sanguinolenta]|uniref:mannan endo-1,4-beta-mannosidase n=1 Tax=Mycena sanguinolenta TaxID=230812 RepID=A0A8H7CFQ5_9AGAR|nr:Carbohydrate-binding module family 1 protein/glycoside hydrolase family 5 protein [Mycena sanguinolenta]